MFAAADIVCKGQIHVTELTARIKYEKETTKITKSVEKMEMTKSQDSQAKTRFVEGPEMTKLQEEMAMTLFYQM